MAERSTGIRVNVKPGDKSGLRDIENEGRKVGGSLKSAIGGALSEGMKGGTEAVKGLLSGVKGLVGTIGGLAGGLGVAELAKHAVTSQGEIRRLAFRIGETREGARQLGVDLRKMAVDTGQPVEELTEKFADLRTKSGDTDFTKASMKAVAEAATATGYAMQPLVDIVDATNAAFAVTAEEVPDTLATMIGLANKSGLSIEEFAQKFELVGVSAKAAGLEGQDGLQKTAALMAMADASAGGLRKGLPALTSLLDTLGNKAARTPVLLRMGINPNVKGDATDVIGEILKKTGGRKEELEKSFGGAQLKLLVDMGKSYAEAFEGTKGNVKAKTEAGLSAYQAALKAAGTSTLTAADIQRQFAEEMQSSDRQISVAMERLKAAFAKPEVVGAIEKMMGLMPKLASGLEKLVTLAADNPAAAAGAVVGGTFAKGAIESAIMGAFTKGSGGIASAIAGAGPGVAAGITSAGGWAKVGGVIAGPIGIAIGAGVVAALALAKADADDEQKRRDAAARDAQRALKGNKGPLGGAYQAAGALEAATGVEFDPGTAISDDTAGRATSGEAERDKVLEERLQAKAKREREALTAGNALAMKYGWNLPQESLPQGGVDPAAVSSGYGAGNASGAAAPSAPAQPAFDPNVVGMAVANGMGSKVFRVEVTNAKDIGGGGGPTGGVVLPPGWKPR